MKKITIVGEAKQQDMLFWEILLEEKYVGEGLVISREELRKVGGINHKIRAKADYELLLRLAEKYELAVTEWAVTEDYATEAEQVIECGDDATEAEQVIECGDNVIVLSQESDALESLRTDCYVIGKYKEPLLEMGYFNPAVENVVLAAQQAMLENDIVPFLEQMISRTERYHEIDDAVRPILIYKGSSVCHNVLNVFAESFGAALEAEGENVEYYDVESRPISEIVELVGRRYKAIIGFQTYAFTIMMKDNRTYLHNLIGGKKYNFVFDHPIWMLPHLQHGVKDFYVLTHDENYVRFTEEYYGQRAYLLPPAGLTPSMADKPSDGLQHEMCSEKKYGLSFVGTYGDYMNEILLIHGMDRKQRFLANHFLIMMRKHPNVTAEEALAKTLEARGISLSKEEFLQQFYELRRVIYCVMHHYRHKVLKAILEAGIRLEVFGDSWQRCPLQDYENLICHPNVTVEESLGIWSQSKLSLNIMSWHKAGFTERIANSMLAGSVVITDKSDYLKAHFTDGEDMVLFDLERIEELPERIKELLADDAKRELMAERAREAAQREHTWQMRAKEFLELVERE